MKLKFTNISDGAATMLIYKHIGMDDEMGVGVDGNSFANEIIALNEYYPNLNRINIRINSVGGSVAEGYSICSSILNSKIPCNTYIDGMAYSMAGVIAMCGQKRYIRDYGTFMMHNPQGNSNVKVMELITESLATIFEQTSGLTLDRCKDLMAMETWMCATECRDGLGFEIVETGARLGVPPPITETTNLYELQNIYNKFINQKQKITMEKVTNFLKLTNDATEDAIIKSIVEIKNEAETKEAEKEDLKAKIAELEAKLAAFEDIEKEAEKAAVESEITNAITEGKILAESKEKWLNRGLKSSDLKDIFADLKTTPVHTPITNVIKEKAAELKEDRSEWTFSMWEKKDAAGLKDMFENNKVAFDNLLATIPTNIKSKK